MAVVDAGERAAISSRLAGEDAPPWLAGAFSSTGVAMALAASYLAAAPPSVEAPAPAPEPRIEEKAPPPEATQPLQPPDAEKEPSAPAKEEAPVQEHPAEAPPRPAVECLPIVSIAFSFKSARPLTEGAKDRLAPLLDWLRDRPYARLLVEGHTDGKGLEAYNVMLSYARAQAVIAWLEKLGVPKSQMTPLAAGPAQPSDRALIVAGNRMALLQVAGVAPCPRQGAPE